MRFWTKIWCGDNYFSFTYQKKIWCGDRSLKDLYPDLFALAVSKEASVALSRPTVYGSGSSLKSLFLLTFLGSRAGVSGILFRAHTPSLMGPDKFLWKSLKKGRFEVRSYYNVLRGFSGLSFPWKSIWIASVLKRWCSLCGLRPWGKSDS